jgi:Flp pilus assembly protein TadG
MLPTKSNNETVRGATRGAVRMRQQIRGKARGGQALVEFAMIVPLLLLLIVLTVNFGGLINAWVTVQSTTRAAADYAVLSGSSAGLPTQANSTGLQNLIMADMSGLPNVVLGSNPTVCVRQNNNRTLLVLWETPAGCLNLYSAQPPPMDGEDIASGSSTTYVNVAVDITYTYTSLFTGNSFMGLPLTVLPNTIHQRAVMRIQ